MKDLARARYAVYQKWLEVHSKRIQLWESVKSLVCAIEFILEQFDKEELGGIEHCLSLLNIWRVQFGTKDDQMARRDYIYRLVYAISDGRGELPDAEIKRDSEFEDKEIDEESSVQCDILDRLNEFLRASDRAEDFTNTILCSIEGYLQFSSELSYFYELFDEEVNCDDIKFGRYLLGYSGTPYKYGEDDFSHFIVMKKAVDKCLDLLSLWRQEVYLSYRKEIYIKDAVLKLVNALYEGKGLMPSLVKPISRPMQSDEDYLKYLNPAQPLHPPSEI